MAGSLGVCSHRLQMEINYNSRGIRLPFICRLLIMSHHKVQFSAFSKALYTKISLHLQNSPLWLGICPKELKAGTQTDICTTMLTAALFTIAKRWKQPKYPSMNEWINKMCACVCECVCVCVYVYAMEYYPGLKRKEILTHAIIWMELENTKWTKPVTKGQILYDSTYMRYQSSQIHGDSRMAVSRGCGRGDGSCCFMGT